MHKSMIVDLRHVHVHVRYMIVMYEIGQPESSHSPFRRYQKLSRHKCFGCRHKVSLLDIHGMLGGDGNGNTLLVLDIQERMKNSQTSWNTQFAYSPFPKMP